MQISRQKVASIHYTLTDDHQQVRDSSDGSDPLVYIHGIGNLISGLEAQLEGKGAGDRFKTSIVPAQAYGDRDEDLVHTLDAENFAGIDDLRVGLQLEASAGGDDEEESNVVTVVAIEGDEVTVDGNHPLAGVTLHFDVRVVSVRDATAEELDHGHVHGAGGHHH